MTYFKKNLVFCLVILTLTVSPLSGLGQSLSEQVNKNRDPADPGAMLVDLVLARPAGLVATVAGSVIFIVALPFSLLGDNTDETWESLVVSPAEYTFKRPIGRFED